MTGLEDATILLRQRLWQPLSATQSVGDPGMSAREINARKKGNERAAVMKSSESRVVPVRFSTQGQELKLAAPPPRGRATFTHTSPSTLLPVYAAEDFIHHVLVQTQRFVSGAVHYRD
ncbi:unnamed protein product [Pleuronectes platessa]|uniref:Uncharacterized protein n=1 Tax=Pleuronectes platessa TaxID=8262 RepID=A0A9N7UMZ9_PLEPL|nr:unnamed protein product [Pleuronectes platessa]